MSEGRKTTTRLIAGTACVLDEIRVDDRGTDPAASIALFRPAAPEEIVDAESLLRDAVVPEPPYWALVWIGAQAIARRLLECPPPPTASVCDLGCGLGLSGLAAGRSGAHILFCDLAAECLPIVEASARENSLRSFEVRRVDFTRDRLGTRFDLISAADIVYDPEAYAPLADFIASHLADGGEVLVTESLRADTKVFLAMLGERGFEDRAEAVWVREDSRRERTWLHTLRKV